MTDGDRLRIAYAVAGAFRRFLWPGEDLWDLVGAAYLGIIDAEPRWRGGRGTTLETFVGIRARGAMRDWLRVLRRPILSPRKDRPWRQDRPHREPVELVEVGSVRNIPGRTPENLPTWAVVSRRMDTCLTARQAATMRRIYWLGESGVEIAGDSGTTGASVSQMAARAVRSLRDGLLLQNENLPHSKSTQLH